VRAPHFFLLPLTVVWEASTPHGRTPAEVGFQGSRKQGRSIWMGDAEKARQALKAAVPVRSHMAGPQPRFPDEAGALVFPGGRGRWVAPLQNTAALSALRLAEQGSDGRPLVQSSAAAPLERRASARSHRTAPGRQEASPGGEEPEAAPPGPTCTCTGVRQTRPDRLVGAVRKARFETPRHGRRPPAAISPRRRGRGLHCVALGIARIQGRLRRLMHQERRGEYQLNASQ
jgi:hypothetical protein